MLKQAAGRIQQLRLFKGETIVLQRIFSTQSDRSKSEDDEFGEDLVKEALERAKLKNTQEPITEVRKPAPKGGQQLLQEQQQQQKQQQFEGDLEDEDVESLYTRSWKNLTDIPTLPQRLTYLGAVPLWVLSPPVVRNIVDPLLQTNYLMYAGQLQMVYTAGILSFLGAVHWGVALVDGKDFETASNRENAVRYLWGVTPMLLAWPVAVLLDPGQAGIIMAGLFMLCFDIDHRMTSRGMLPPWYMRIRGTVSLIAMAAVTLTFADSYGRWFAQKNREMMEEEVAAYEAGQPMDTPEVIDRFIQKLMGRDEKEQEDLQPPTNSLQSSQNEED
eukprot:TRINITY_DN40174_c0_g1_i1.p1 TRINITY_DN40174_c0_g1~~TRINITY_DN40174_c0_g1_i1.p1  ORF type:complete len:330 (-),score=52.19 TRINITY_DN40174_c0_g1_i1:188-1177(-)